MIPPCCYVQEAEGTKDRACPAVVCNDTKSLRCNIDTIPPNRHRPVFASAKPEAAPATPFAAQKPQRRCCRPPLYLPHLYSPSLPRTSSFRPSLRSMTEVGANNVPSSPTGPRGHFLEEPAAGVVPPVPPPAVFAASLAYAHSIRPSAPRIQTNQPWRRWRPRERASGEWAHGDLGLQRLGVRLPPLSQSRPVRVPLALVLLGLLLLGLGPGQVALVAAWIVPQVSA